jgi:hypothetical protein
MLFMNDSTMAVVDVATAGNPFENGACALETENSLSCANSVLIGLHNLPTTSTIITHEDECSVTTAPSSNKASAMLVVQQSYNANTSSTNSSIVTNDTTTNKTIKAHKRKRKNDRHVTFAMNAHDDPYVQIYEPKGPLMNRSKQWWRPRDFRQFKEGSKQLALVARNTSEYYTEFLRLYEVCDRPHFIFDEHPLNISDTEARGLENAIFPMLLADRKAVIQAVLRVQEKVTTDMSPNRRVKVLAAVSMFMSRHARALARAVAIGDEVIAEKLHRE